MMSLYNRSITNQLEVVQSQECLSYKSMAVTGEHILKNNNTSSKSFAFKILSPFTLVV